MRTFDRTAAFLATLCLGLALIAVPGALASRSYTDPTGDSGGAPDISSVGVSHDNAGRITLTITTNQPTLAADATFWGYLDTDVTSTTGLPHRGLGVDHFFLADATGGMLAHVVDNRISFDFNSTFTAGYANGTLTAQFDRSELGASERFAFLLESDQDDEDGDTIASDSAPNGPPFYEYSFVAEALTLIVARPSGVPAKPVAGKSFVVTARVTRSDGEPLAEGQASCRVRIGKTPLRTRGQVASGLGRCQMQIPRGASRKTLRGSITVSVETAAPVTRAFSFRIR